jgi:hypothetical protein
MKEFNEFQGELKSFIYHNIEPFGTVLFICTSDALSYEDTCKLEEILKESGDFNSGIQDFQNYLKLRQL